MNCQNRSALHAAAGAAAFLLATVSGRSLHAQDSIYYAVPDGSVQALDIATGQNTTLLPSNAFAGGVVGAARQLAFDAVSRLMYYSSPDGAIRSVNVDNRRAGPTLPSNAIPVGSAGADRPVCIDDVGRRLLVPLGDGSVQMYDLANLQPVGRIPRSAFQNSSPAVFRLLASDPRRGTIWFAHSDGSFREIDPDTGAATGRLLPLSVQVGATTVVLRHFTIDAGRDLLLYPTVNGTIASIQIAAVAPGPLTLASNQFRGGGVGALRSFTSDASRFPSSSNPFGTGCPGTAGTPRLIPGLTLPGTVTGGPIAGRSFTQLAFGVPRNAMCVMLTGQAQTGFFGQIIFGAPGCRRLVTPDVVTPLQNSFLLAFTVNIPADPALLGTRFYNQLFVTDPGVNLANTVVSNATNNLIGTY